MFDGDLAELDAATTLTVAAQWRAAADNAEAHLLQVAAHFADLHPEPESGLSCDDDGVILPGMEDTEVYGGDGCPEVAEFAPVELGTVLGITSHAATRLIGDALALRHRLPKTWARVLAGQVQAWRARQIAAACWTLSQKAARLVDDQVAGAAQSLTSYRLAKIVRAAVLEADPDQAEKAAKDQAAERGVWIEQTDAHGSKAIFVKAAAGDVIRFDASIDHIADLLAQMGDTDTKDLRRAKAIGWLANPQATLNLWNQWHRHTNQPTDPDTDQAEADPTADHTSDEHTAAEHPAADEHPGDEGATATAETTAEGTGGTTAETTGESGRATGETGREPSTAGRGDRPQGELDGPDSPGMDDLGVSGVGGLQGLGRYTLYVHLTDLTLATGMGLARVGDSKLTQRHAGKDGLGPVLASQLAELLGHPDLIDKITIKPVIDLADRIAVDSYEIPDRIRERVILRYPRCVFPWCNRPAAGTDLDHVDPYDHSDTGPPGQTSTENLGPCCRFHHRVKTHSRWKVRRLDDGAFEWTSPKGHTYRVDHTGTHPITKPPS